ncbi:hypothetical protein MCBRY_004181 [Methylocystis bryophila]
MSGTREQHDVKTREWGGFQKLQGFALGALMHRSMPCRSLLGWGPL